ncbi:hypothetical protein [Photorhabdus hainanensis]|uniref:hypothetical protein n=1 Tax=Photorhabdus hainanensis TaxID=1004166 RepID=UPI001BD23712|nr:hypothetical protein [Photorhabdus hainanensis]MBS9432814.1 hypothetical protein [Photorhabdus hainanensis]
MFKKLLTVGALATALIGGVGTASAGPCNSPEPQPIGGGKYYRYVINPYDNFANSFSESTKYGWITWHFKHRIGPCEFHTGYNAFQAYYEGRIN